MGLSYQQNIHNVFQFAVDNVSCRWTIIQKTTTKNKYTFFNVRFHVYSVKIIGMWSDRMALITGQLQTFAAVLIVPLVKLLVLCFNQTRIGLFESHAHGLQSSIVATNSIGNNSNFITLIGLEGWLCKTRGLTWRLKCGILRSENKITVEVRKSAVVGFI